MIYNMYSVKDVMTNKFMNPMFVEQEDHADLQAIRQFKSNVNNIKLWKDNPNDFELWKVGIFDDESGAAATANEKIVSGRACVDGNTD